MAVFLAGAPALAVLLGIVLLGEVPTLTASAGLMVTTAGMVLAIGRRSPDTSR
jgi:drug/metabolite transporter (DMT)-like permease